MKKSKNWLILIHQIPPRLDSFRVKVWRALQKAGAMQLKNSVYVLPTSEKNKTRFASFVNDICKSGGDAFLCSSEFILGIEDDEIISLFKKDRAAKYELIADELRTLQKVFSCKKKPSENDLMTIEHSIGKLERQIKELTEIDFFHTEEQDSTAKLLHTLSTKVSKLRGGVQFEHVKSRDIKDYQGLTWVTRSDIHVDRLASAWLIGKYIDKKVKFKFVEENNYNPNKNEVRFDMFNGEFTHVGDKCTFEVLGESFSILLKGIKVISEIIHDLDLKDTKYNRPETSGIGIVLKGIIANEKKDLGRIKKANVLFDELFGTLQPPFVEAESVESKLGFCKASRTKSYLLCPK